jgi:hypothetical protein
MSDQAERLRGEFKDHVAFAGMKGRGDIAQAQEIASIVRLGSLRVSFTPEMGHESKKRGSQS